MSEASEHSTAGVVGKHAAAPEPLKPVEQREGPTLSVVIPTRNRPDSLRRVIGSLASQDHLPDEIIIADASDEPTRASDFVAEGMGMPPVTVLHVAPHLCRQRNEGVRASRGDFLFLCDDDVELPRDYLSRLVRHLATHPDDGAVTGAFRDRADDGSFPEAFPVPSLGRLLAAAVFQLSVWGDIERMPRRPFRWMLVRPLEAWYRRRGNTWSLAGWPLLTQVRGDVVHAAVYSLGAALVRRGWLITSPYDERLGPHGIGDHYGVALGFPRCPGIAILTRLEVLHHRAPGGRLRPEDAHFERVMALDHFTRSSHRFSVGTTTFLVWSLVGNAALSVWRGRWLLVRRTLQALVRITTGRNPLRRGSRYPVGGGRFG